MYLTAQGYCVLGTAIKHASCQIANQKNMYSITQAHHSVVTESCRCPHLSFCITQFWSHLEPFISRLDGALMIASVLCHQSHCAIVL